VVEHQVVAVGVGEEGHQANAGIERVAGEADALGLELATGGRDVIDGGGWSGMGDEAGWPVERPDRFTSRPR